MLKILYAAANSENSKIQLIRFLQAVQNKPYIIKVAAYKISSPQIQIDWTLDSLLNILRPSLYSTDNDNFSIYFDQIKNFDPDLIISDLEYFTSYIGHSLDIPVWQCSSALTNFALVNKYDIGLFKTYSYILNRDFSYMQRMINIIDNSEYNFVYSHFGDINCPPQLKDNFSWITPYHQIGKLSIPCKHNIVAGSLKNYKPILQLLNNYEDCVMFSEDQSETYKYVKLKNIHEQHEYFCNLRNSKLFVCAGQSSFLADAFYNKKHSIVVPCLTNDITSIINTGISEKLGLSSTLYTSDSIANYLEIVVPTTNNYQPLLHEKIEEIFS